MGKKKKKKRNFKKYLIISFIVSLAIWAASPHIQVLKNKEEINNLQNELKVLESKNKKLEYEIRRMKSDAYIEVLAREQLGLAKPGEETYSVVLPKNDQPDKKNQKSKGSKANGKENKSIFTLILENIKNLLGL